MYDVEESLTCNGLVGTLEDIQISLADAVGVRFHFAGVEACCIRWMWLEEIVQESVEKGAAECGRNAFCAAVKHQVGYGVTLS
ncbi:hypothetical protein DOTSEDRAFT_46817 [Dothistroma septosporum NZE10]|uniref:Uncharacterized protein n=1 Tax=Dothistroma septosporum (strain NZE10 / CBS 128990) TaxID=675120 RepID=N1PGH8_DOTSN|nr:hypothetical protein DOTSEDRAFT_46817 [Dothistroma septosporum NZE10]